MKKLLYLVLMFLSCISYATTRNVVPQADNEGSIGTSLKRWTTGYFINIISTVTYANDAGLINGITGTSLQSQINGKQAELSTTTWTAYDSNNLNGYSGNYWVGVATTISPATDLTNYAQKSDSPTWTGTNTFSNDITAKYINTADGVSIGRTERGKLLIITNSFIQKPIIAKMQPHCHTTNSDGLMTPLQVLLAYQTSGYNVVNFSDHDVCTSTDAVDGMLAITGVEETAAGGQYTHILAVGVSSQTVLTNGQGIIDWVVKSKQGWGCMAHPGSTSESSEGTWADNALLELHNYDAVEVHNDTGYYNGKIDRLYSKGKKFWIEASDDAHNVTMIGHNWLAVNVDTITQPAIMSALKSGNFTANYVTTCTITNMAVNNLTVTATFNTVVPQIQWVTKDGTVRTTYNVTQDTYAITGDEIYVRLQIIAPSPGFDGYVWSQPIFIDTLDANTAEKYIQKNITSSGDLIQVINGDIKFNTGVTDTNSTTQSAYEFNLSTRNDTRPCVKISNDLNITQTNSAQSPYLNINNSDGRNFQINRSISNNTLTIINTANKAGSTAALNFNAGDARCVAPSISSYTINGDFSLEAVVKAYNTDLDDQVIVISSNGATGPPYISFIKSSSGAGLWRWYVGTDTEAIAGCNSNSAPTTNWVHLLGRRTNGLLEFFIDGIKQTQTQTKSGRIFTNSGLVMGIAPNLAAEFKGAIDEVRLWDYSISDSSVTWLYNTGVYRNKTEVDSSRLIAGFALDENTGSSATDYSPNANTATITISTWTTGVIINAGTPYSATILEHKDGANQGDMGRLTLTSKNSLSNYGQVNIDSLFTTFAINGTEKARIDSAGNVGIGTTAPLATLDVAGNITGNSNQLVISTVAAYGVSGLDFKTDDSVIRMRIKDTGKIIISTYATPSTLFEVKNGSITISGSNANLIVGGDTFTYDIFYSTTQTNYIVGITTPTVEGISFYDPVNKMQRISTGTSNCFDYR